MFTLDYNIQILKLLEDRLTRYRELNPNVALGFAGMWLIPAYTVLKKRFTIAYRHSKCHPFANRVSLACLASV